MIARGGGGGASASASAPSSESTKTSDLDDVVVRSVNTSPIEGMKPGTSGLRKKVEVWKTGHYVENFVQSLVDTIRSTNGGEMIDT
jgi:phosphoglucomutase